MKLLYKSILSVSALLLLGACSSDDSWEPGPAGEPTMGVFFTGLEKYDVTVEADDPHVFTVQVDRIDATSDASVPLDVLACPEGVVVPGTVDFAAGETTAYFDIDVNNMAIKTTGDISLRIDPAYAAMYGAGTSEMSMKVTIAGGWVLLADDLKIEYYFKKFPDQTTTLYVLDGSNRFKIPNFMNSGVDFVFSVYSTTMTYPYIIPFTNYVYSESSYDIDDVAWYLYDTANASYPSNWTPVGGTKALEYVTFYTFDGDDYASWIGINKGLGELTCYFDYADGSGAWEYLELSFTPKFNPFEQQ